MTHNRILFLLPLMAMPLVACNSNNMTPIDYAATNELAENYIKTISDSRLKPISSRYKLDVNALTFQGDLIYGKSINLEDFTFSAFNKTLLDVEIPTGLYTKIEDSLSREIGAESSFYMIMAKYLLHPEFNPHLLTLIDGFKLNEPNGEFIPWKNVEHVPWITLKRTYSKSNDSGLKIDVSTPSIKQTWDEVMARFSTSSPTSLTFDAPLYASMSVDKYGYISSFSLKFDCKAFKIGDKDKGKFYINGDINIDATLSFSHTFSKIVPIRYQTIEYEVVEAAGRRELKIKEGGVSGFYDNIDDIKYKRADGTEHKVFTAQWYANKAESEQGKGYNYGCDDDPLFNYSFFDKIAKNEAFLQNNYDVVLIPDYDLAEGTKDFVQKIHFLGYNYMGDDDPKDAEDSLCKISIDGNDENFSTKGINENTVAGDQPVEGVTIVDPDDATKTIPVLGAYNFYIDKSLIMDKGSYYLITVAFTQYSGE